MKKVYKLVSVKGDKRLSFNLCIDDHKPNGRDILEYSQGVTTRPTFGKLYAFESFEAALKYARPFTRDREYYEIWESLAGKVYALDAKICTMGHHYFEDFWSGADAIPYSVAPDGTVLCSSIKLVRMIVSLGGNYARI